MTESLVIDLSKSEKGRNDEGRGKRDPEEIGARMTVELVELTRDLGCMEGAGGWAHRFDRRHARLSYVQTRR
jgi:hypothetical protein